MPPTQEADYVADDVDEGACEASESLNVVSKVAPGPLSQETFFIMARASAFGSADANKALAPLGLKVRHYSALTMASAEEPKAPTQRDMAQYLALDPSQIVAIVDWLEKRKLVKRKPDPRDRRSKIVVATAKGHGVLDEARQLTQQATVDTLSGLAPSERKTLHELLVRVAFER